MLFAAIVAGFFFVNGEASQRAEAVTTTIGLVNEDLPAKFNGAEYTFGANFVDRISKDAEYNWTVLSRSVAEKAFKDGSVDAVIYLPQSFSHDILTFQELDPTKATVEYKLQYQPNEQADRLLDTKIVSVVSGFNQGVVKMYYASLADNFAEADGHMRDSLTNQELLIKAFTADVQEPFSETMPNFKSFVESTEVLKGVNASTVEAQNSFTESVMVQLTNTGETFSGKLPEIEGYTKRQQEIARINAVNSNKGITDQATSDRDFYGAQFEALQTSTLCKLSGHDVKDVDEACKDADGSVPVPLRTHVEDLRTAATNYAGAVDMLQGNAATVQQSLTDRIANLQAFLQQISPPEDPGTPETGPSSPTPELVMITPEMLAQLTTELNELSNARALLHTEQVPGPEFATVLTDLDAWYAATVNSTKEASLPTSTVKSLEVKDWTSGTPEGTDLYIDTSAGLHKSITELVSQSAEANGNIGESDLKVPDNSAQFDALLKNASDTYAGAGRVQGGANDLLTTGSMALGENQEFYSSFSTVLANTRTQGVDTGKINEFMSAPITAKNITPVRAPIEESLDLQWMLIFAGGLTAGVVVMLLGGLVRKKR